MKKCDYLIVGAGLAGCVFAERITRLHNKKIIIVDKRDHLGGNCFDYFDNNGILVHKYGPHLFHTNSKKVYEYLSEFTDWIKYEHRVLAKYKKEYYPIPINRNTINKFFGVNLIDDLQVSEFIDKIRINRINILNSEDIIISQVGEEIFKAFFNSYTYKQWKLFPKDLQPTVCGRIKIRFNDDDRYFDDIYQVMPKNGYTKLFKELLRNRNIEILLEKEFVNCKNIDYKYLIYTGPIDEFFNYKFGKLDYRSIKFKFKNYKKNYFQKAAQINYVEPDVAYTRVSEYKYITSQESKTTTVSYEYPNNSGDPYYPIPSEKNIKIHKNYFKLTKSLKNAMFCGRLAEYKYYNMDQVVARTLNLFNKLGI